MDKYIKHQILYSNAYYSAFSGINSQNGQRVIIKQLKTKFNLQKNFRLHFDNWFKSVQQLSHPHIIPVIDAFKDYDYFYIIQPEINAKPIDKKLPPFIDPLLAADLLLQILDAIQYAHKFNFNHGSLSPEKIYITDDYKILIDDFGLIPLLNSSKPLPTEDMQNFYELVWHSFIPKLKNPDKFIKLLPNTLNETDWQQALLKIKEIFAPSKSKKNTSNTKYLPSPKQKNTSFPYKKNKFIHVVFFFILLVIALSLLSGIIFTNKQKDNFIIKLPRFVKSCFLFPQNNNNLLIFIQTDTIYNLILQVHNKNIINSNVIDLEHSPTFGLAYHNDILYMATGKIIGPNSTVPCLILIFNNHYEPFYKTEELGLYTDIKINNNKLFLLKENFKQNYTDTSSISLEIRKTDLSLIKNIKLIKNFRYKSNPSNLLICHNKFLFQFHNSDSSKILCFNQNGQKLWSYQYFNPFKLKNNICSDSQHVYIASLPKHKFINSLYLTTLSPNGHKIDSSVIHTKSLIKNIIKILSYKHFIIIGTSSIEGNSEIIIFDKNSKKFKTKYFANFNKQKLLDFIPQKNKIITVFQTNYPLRYANPIQPFLSIKSLKL